MYLSICVSVIRHSSIAQTETIQRFFIRHPSLQMLWEIGDSFIIDKNPSSVIHHLSSIFKTQNVFDIFVPNQMSLTKMSLAKCPLAKCPFLFEIKGLKLDVL